MRPERKKMKKEPSWCRKRAGINLEGKNYSPWGHRFYLQTLFMLGFTYRARDVFLYPDRRLISFTSHGSLTGGEPKKSPHSLVHNSPLKCLLRFHSMKYTTERVLPANAVWFWEQPFASFPYKHAGSPLFPCLKYAAAVPLLWFMEPFVRQRPSETRCFDLRHLLVIFFLLFRNLTSGRLGGLLGKWLKVALCSGVEM